MQHNSILFETLFKRSFVDKENKAFLEQFTTTYPYFSIAHFYLLQQTNKNATDYDRQAAKTSIHFNNPYWLNFQLKQAYKLTILPEKEIIQSTQIEKEPQQSIIKAEAENNQAVKEALLFEPMHMVDYFASQGIKLDETLQPTDKLGKQLKSFTEWLKTMKKLHISKAQADNSQNVKISTETETVIQKLAEKSNSEDEILTESMADILAKQGKNDKAIEVYQKLSLLNPSKIAYFAAKIQQLKG